MTAPTPPRFALHPQAAHRAVASEVFVVTGDRAFHRMANSSAVFLFETLAAQPAGATAAALAAELCARFDVDAASARADVDVFLQTLVQRQLAVRVDAAPTFPDSPEVSP